MVGEATAGGVLELVGSNWFFTPDGVNSVCRGTVLPDDAVTVVLRFSTLSDPEGLP